MGKFLKKKKPTNKFCSSPFKPRNLSLSWTWYVRMNDKTRRRRDLYKSDFKSEPVEISADWRSTQDPLWLMDNLHLCPVTEVTWESINVETDRRMLAGPLSVLCPVSWNQEDIKAVWFLDSFWWQPLSLPTRLCLLTLSCFGRKNNSRLPLSNDRLDVMYSNMPAEAHFGGRVLWSVAFDATFFQRVDWQAINPANQFNWQTVAAEENKTDIWGKWKWIWSWCKCQPPFSTNGILTGSSSFMKVRPRPGATLTPMAPTGGQPKKCWCSFNQGFTRTY